MNITMNNHNDPAYEVMFEELLREAFCFSFTPWLNEKVWDERYESYSVIEDSKMLANVCVYKADMLINGKPVRAHQFGGVTTRASERGKGYQRALMEHILQKYPDTPAFLYANETVRDFYPRFGFRRAKIFRPMLDVKIDNTEIKSAAVKLTPNDGIVRKAIYGGRVFSNIADCSNTQPIQIFHLLLDYADGIYYLPKYYTLVVVEQRSDGKLFLADVISEQTIKFADIITELPFNGVETVEFGFCPDKLGVSPRWEEADSEHDPFFVRGEWNLPERFCFPIMSQT